MEERAEELTKKLIEIIAVQKTRRSGTGLIKKKTLSFYYSGSEDQARQAGTGFIRFGEITNNVIGSEVINKRV
jgi:hypothetical protein